MEQPHWIVDPLCGLHRVGVGTSAEVHEIHEPEMIVGAATRWVPEMAQVTSSAHVAQTRVKKNGFRG